MTETIKKIVEASIHAPSGDNSQPWKFALQDSTLKIFNRPEADDSFYNFRQRGSLVSHGALLENIIITATALGLDAKISLFPDPDNPDHVATINFETAAATADPLSEMVVSRATNRKPYEKQPLTAEQKQALTGATAKFAGLQFHWLENPENISGLAKILSLNERLILENRSIHDGLFKFIRWNKEEENRAKTGLYIKTLELEPPQEMAFKLFRKWPVINFLNKFGVSKLVAKDSAKLYAATSGYGAIEAATLDSANFIATGRMLQRIWLTAASLNLSLQPTTALLYLGQRIAEGDTKAFSGEHITLIQKANINIRNIFQITDGELVMLFRIGTGRPPAARSLKQAPIIESL